MKTVRKTNRTSRSRLATRLLLVIAAGLLAAPLHAGESEISDHPAAMAAAKLGDTIKAGDVALLKTLVSPKVLIFESGGVESSLAEYESHHMPADMAFMKGIKSEVISRRVIEAGDSAIVMTQSRLKGAYKEKEIDLSSTETLVMEATEGKWKIVHIHWSSR